jgi:hypothetical protein
MAHTEVKLVNVPEMDYMVNDSPQPRGEVCFRGPSLMEGYYKDEQKTAEVLDKDGWYHTGDIGVLQPNGTLKIVDRVKNIFKLAQGRWLRTLVRFSLGAPRSCPASILKHSSVWSVILHRLVSICFSSIACSFGVCVLCASLCILPSSLPNDHRVSLVLHLQESMLPRRRSKT